MNDPNGLIHYQGRYHLFYQHNPNGAFWGTMHWGHASSTDLVNWHYLPIALAPDPDGPDRDGCYSGATVVHEGVPTLVYTGVRERRQLPCLAMSGDEDLATWTTNQCNPVVGETAPDLPTTIFRDHTLWREDDGWMMGIGAGIKEQGGAVLLYRSSDLRHWEYLHPLVVEDPSLNQDGQLISHGWECPDFFFLEQEPVLIACEWDGDPLSVSYWTGTYHDRQFQPDRKGLVDAGSPFYAPQTLRDANGRRLMFGWLMETRGVQAQKDAGWSGAMSLPRLLTLDDDGRVCFTVAPEVETLRGRSVTIDGYGADGLIERDGIPGDTLEISAIFAGDAPGGVVLRVRCAPDRSEETVVRWNPTCSSLSLDTTYSSLDPDTTGEVVTATLNLSPGEPVSLRVFIDCSVIEVYANERIGISGRAYPTREDSLNVHIAGEVSFSEPVSLYEMLAATYTSS